MFVFCVELLTEPEPLRLPEPLVLPDAPKLDVLLGAVEADELVL
jgi:hypothetical protein